jgi:ribosomal protein S18 acetylase RimI-like enzyme
MFLRTMTTSDIPAGMRLKELAGWNQTAADWKRFLDASPQGCFVAELDGAVRGTATTISYENRFAWVGMVLVDPDYRSRGIGTALLAKAIAHLDEQKIPTVKLDATPQGKPLYEKMGFRSEYEIERWTLRRSANADPQSSASQLPEPLSNDCWHAICTADRKDFGADRSLLLKSLHADAPDLATAISNAGTLQGYAFARRGSFADHLGPWVSTDARATRQLLQSFLERSTREFLIVDCLKANIAAGNLLKSFGFAVARPLTRMYRGPNHYPGHPEDFCAILGPEFG